MTSVTGCSAPRVTWSWRRNPWNDFPALQVGHTSPRATFWGGKLLSYFSFSLCLTEKGRLELSPGTAPCAVCCRPAAQAVFHPVLASSLGTSETPLCSVCFCKSVVGRELLEETRKNIKLPAMLGLKQRTHSEHNNYEPPWGLSPIHLFCWLCLTNEHRNFSLFGEIA